MAYALVIGNKTTSSWSLRPWIALRHCGIAFEEIRVNLRDPGVKRQILAHSPSGKVPALIADGSVIWDSLAILEFLAEAHPEAGLWPQDRWPRARARSVAAEMHSGFQALRQDCPMDYQRRVPEHQLSSAAAADVRRIVELWGDCRRSFGGEGPFLFGAFTAADAMYAPIVSRFITYVPDLAPFGDDGAAAAYVDAVFALPAMRQWEKDAAAEMTALKP